MRKVLVFLMVAVMAVSLSLPAFAAPLTDVPETHWAAEAVNMLTEIGVLTGYTDQTFRGQQNITRYEVAVSLSRLLIYLESYVAEQIDAINVTGGASNAEVEQLRKEFAVLKENNATVNDLLTLSGRLSYLEARAATSSSISGTATDSAEISALTEKVDALGKQVTAVSSQLVDFTNDVTVLASKITNIEKELLNLKSVDATFENDIATVNAQVEEIKAYISALTVGSNGEIAIDSTIYNSLLTLSGRLSYLETKYAAGIDVNPAVLAEIENLKIQVEALKANPSVESANLISFTNDITVLSSKLINMEKSINSIQSANSALSNDVAAIKSDVEELKAYLSSVTAEGTESLAVDSTIYNTLLTLSGRLSFLETKYAAGIDVNPAVLAEIETLKNTVNNLGTQSYVGSTINSSDLVEFVNDITVLANRLTTAEVDIDKLEMANSTLSKEVAAIKSDVEELKTYLSSVTAEGTESLAIDSTIYNTLLTLSGRLSYLETKYAAGIDVNPAVLAEIEALKNTVNNLGTQSYVGSTINSSDLVEFVNDITVLANRLTTAEVDIDKLEMANSTLSKEVATIKSDVEELKAYLSSATVEGTESLAVDPTIYNTLLTLSGRLSYLETKYAAGIDVNPAVLAEIEVLKSTVNNLGGQSSVSSTINSSDLIAFVNDITVLANRLTTAEVDIDKLEIANSAMNKNIQNLDNRISSVEADLGSLVLSTDLSIVSDKVQVLENTVANLSKSIEFSQVTLTNDITVTNKRIDNLDSQIITLAYNTKAQYAEFSSELTAIQEEVAAIKVFLDSITDEELTIISDPRLYNDFLTVSGRVSYIEQKLANATLINPNLENEVAELKVKLEETNAVISNLATTTLVEIKETIIDNTNLKDNYLGFIIGYDRSSGKVAGEDTNEAYNLFRLGIKGKYNLTDRISVTGNIVARIGKDLSKPSVGYEIAPEIDIYGRYRAFTFGAVDMGIQAGASSAYSFSYETDPKNKVFFGIGFYVDAYVTEKLNLYADVNFPIVASNISSKKTIDIGFVPSFGIDFTAGLKYDISPNLNIGIESEISNMPGLFESNKGFDFHVGLTIGFSF